jgi:hypothetical protein
MAIIFRGLKKYPDGIESGFVSYPEGDEPPPASNGLLNDLVAQWEFNGDGTDSHASQDLTLNNSPTFTTGKLADAMQCEKDNASYASRADASLVLPNADWSLAGWLKITSTDPSGLMCSSNPSISLDMRMIFASPNVFYGACGEIFQATSFTPSVNTWYFIVLQRISNNLELWVDGVRDSVNPLASPAAGDASSELFFGFDNSSGDTADAVYDSWGYRPASLDSTKISALYNSGNGLPYESFTT